MKAVVYEKNGGVDVLEFRELPKPTISSKEVLVKVEYISIEGGDILNRKVVPPPHSPFVPGYQVSGTIEQIGDDVEGFVVGQRVVAFAWSGSHAEYMKAYQRHVFAIPEGVAMDVASTLLVAFGTAHDALFEFGHLQAGESVLIQGATGGVGLAAVQLAKRAGAIVYGSGSGTDRVERLRDFGVDHPINYKTDDLVATIKGLTDNQGVDLVVDLAGGQGISDLLEAVRYRGRFAVIGAATGELPSFPFFDLVRKSLQCYGVSFGREMHQTRVQTMMADIIERFAQGELAMPIEKVFSFDEVRMAHQFVEQGKPFGRVVMKI